jgi:hypothetical protein
MAPERGRFMKVAVRGEELQLTGGEGLFQIVQELVERFQIINMLYEVRAMFVDMWYRVARMAGGSHGCCSTDHCSVD